VGTTFVGIDIVGKSEDLLIVRVVVLDRRLDPDVLPLTRNVDDFRMEGFLVLVQVFDEGDQPALVAVASLLGNSIIGKVDPYPAIQKCEFPHALREDLKTDFGLSKNERIRFEDHSSTTTRGLPLDDQRGFGFSSFVALIVDLTITPDFHLERLAQGVHH